MPRLTEQAKLDAYENGWDSVDNAIETSYIEGKNDGYRNPRYYHREGQTDYPEVPGLYFAQSIEHGWNMPIRISDWQIKQEQQLQEKGILFPPAYYYYGPIPEPPRKEVPHG